MSFQPSKFALAITMTAVFILAPAGMRGQDTSPSSQQPQKNWKDRAEYDLYDAITKDTNPKSRLEKVQQWEKQYPQTDWQAERNTLFLTTYFALGDAKNATDVAKKILAQDPKNFSALYIILTFTQALAGNSPTPEVLDQGEKTANAILANIDTPPANFTPETWKAQRPQVEELAHTTIGWIDMQRKNWQAAEAEFQKSLQVNPTSGQVDYYMGTSLASEKDIKKMPIALFFFARAATYDTPPGALSPAGRQQVLTYVQKAYKNFHGSDEGFNNLVAAAKSQPVPPSDFAIKNATEIAEAQAQNEDEWNKAHPQEALWKSVKAALTGADGAAYFANNMKETQVPTLKGKVVKLEPALKPKTILLAMDDGTNNTTTADATLKLEAPLAGKVDEGTELTFEGVPESYTASPFMVVFNVEKDKLHGWTGKNAPAPVHHRPAAK